MLTFPHSLAGRLCCTLSLSLLAGLKPAAAREAAPAAGAQDSLETIIVTAHRTPVPLPEIGSSVSVVDADRIEARQSPFVTEVLRDLPGVAVSQNATRGSQTQVRIRGAEANHVLVLIDGVKVNDPAGADEFNFGVLTAYDIEHLELVRGPQSALWGSEATAGVISVTTRRGTRPLEASAFTEAGAFGTRAGGGRLAATSDAGQLNFNASYFETEGISAAAAGTEKDGYDNLTLSASGRWNPTSTMRFGFAARHTDDRIEFDGTNFTTGLPEDADRETEKSLLLASVNGGITALRGRWDSTLRFTYLDTDSQDFSDGTSASRLAAEKTGVYLQSSAFIGAAGQIDHQRLTFAVDYEDETYTQRTAFADQDQTLDNTGVVLEYFTGSPAGLSLSASVRYDDNSEFKDVTTWRGTGSWALVATGTRLKASFGTGQKRPTFTERFGFAPDQFIGNPDLKPERNEGFDLGVVQALLDGQLDLQATYFNEKLVDEISTVFDPTTFLATAANLDGVSRRQGAELALAARLSAALELTASYTYTDATQPGATQPSTAGSGRARELRRPRHMAAANLNRKFAGERGNLNLNLSYTGDRTDQFFPPPTFAGETVMLNAYTLLNVAASYRLTGWLTVFGRVENLLDERYQDVVGFATPGRGFYAGVRVGER